MRLSGRCLRPWPIIATLVLSGPAWAQVTFQRYWRWSSDACGSSVEPTDDGGYIVGGYALLDSPPIPYCIVLKTDSLGDTLWSFFSSYKGFGFACQTKDLNYVIATDTPEGGAPQMDLMVIKLNQEGQEVWRSMYCGPGEDAPWGIAATPDGGCIIGGYLSDGSGTGVGLAKLDSSGAFSWLRVHQFDEAAAASSVRRTRDGGYVTAGAILDSAGGADAVVVRTDANGDTVWTRILGHGYPDSISSAYSVCETRDGGVAITGGGARIGAMQATAYLVRLSSCGDSLWTRFYGVESCWVHGRSVIGTEDGGCLIAGGCEYPQRPDMVESLYIVRTDSLGQELWHRVHAPARLSGSPDMAYAEHVSQTPDLGYVTCGPAFSWDAIYLVKTDSLGFVHGGGGLARHGSPVSRDRLSATVTRSLAGILELLRRCGASARLLDVTGREVAELSAGEGCLGHLAPGVYFCQLETSRIDLSRRPASGGQVTSCKVVLTAR